MTTLSTTKPRPESLTAAWLESRSRGRPAHDSVLFHAPSFAFQTPGGGENQLVQTGRSLEALGHSIRLFSPWIDRLDRSRLLHLFGMSREGLELARIAERRGVPVVLSPICWYEPRAIWALEAGLRRKLGGVARWVLRLAAPRIGGWRKELLDLADAVLPNSRMEGEQLKKLFALPEEKIHVVPNGVSEHFRHATPDRFRSERGEGEFILSVGRIEPRKNTLGLIQAARSLGMPVVVIGEVPAGSEDYAVRCRQAGQGLVTWLGGKDHHDPFLASAYAAARGLALPSWFETPGLAALEAALTDCPVLITPYGSTREYFGDLANYARPHRRDEITRGLEECWQRGRNSSLSRFVASRYLWPVVSQRTAEVYDQVTG